MGVNQGGVRGVGASLIAAAWLAFLPRYGFLAASLNDDNLLGLLAALYFFCLVQAIKQPTTWRPFIGLGVTLGLSMTVKYTLVIAPLEVIICCVLLGRPHGWQWITRRVVLVGALALLTSSPWFGWNIWHLQTVTQDGWLMGLTRPLLAGGSDPTMNRLNVALSQGLNAATDTIDPNRAGSFNDWLRETYLSFWGVGVSGTWPMFPWAYLLITILLGGAAIGLWQLWQREPTSRLWLGLMLGHVGLFLLLPIMRFNLAGRLSQSAQGRHILIPAATAVMGLIVWGLLAIIPIRWQRLTFIMLTISLTLWTAQHIQALAVSVPPAVPLRTIATADMPPPKVNFDDKIALQDYQLTVEPTQLQLNLTWRALTFLNENYLYQVTILNQTQQPVLHWQGYHGQGRVPTLAWDTDMLIFDRLTLPLPPDAGTYQVQIQLLGAGGSPISGQNGERKSPKIGEFSRPSSFSSPFVFNQFLTLGAQEIGYKVWTTEVTPTFRYPATILLLTSPLEENITVELLDTANQAWLPTSYINGVYNFIISPRWSSGAYRLRLTRHADQSIEHVTSSPMLTVENWWPRHFAPPEPIASPQTANFANQLQFLGYTLPQNQVKAGEALPLTLYWQAPADKAPQADFMQFNHLLDSAGQPHGGYERRPLEYYSTLLWSPGEVVADGYTIPVAADAPPGQYYLDVGYYINVGGSAVNLPLVIDGKMSDISHVTIGPIEVIR